MARRRRSAEAVKLLRWPILLGLAVYLVARMAWEGVLMGIAVLREASAKP